LFIPYDVVEPGHSGGGVFNQDWRLEGMMLQISEDAAEVFRIEPIVRKLTEWGIPVFPTLSHPENYGPPPSVKKQHPNVTQVSFLTSKNNHTLFLSLLSNEEERLEGVKVYIFAQKDSMESFLLGSKKIKFFQMYKALQFVTTEPKNNLLVCIEQSLPNQGGQIYSLTTLEREEGGYPGISFPLGVTLRKSPVWTTNNNPCIEEIEKKPFNAFLPKDPVAPKPKTFPELIEPTKMSGSPRVSISDDHPKSDSMKLMENGIIVGANSSRLYILSSDQLIQDDHVSPSKLAVHIKRPTSNRISAIPLAGKIDTGLGVMVLAIDRAKASNLESKDISTTHSELQDFVKGLLAGGNEHFDEKEIEQETDKIKRKIKNWGIPIFHTLQRVNGQEVSPEMVKGHPKVFSVSHITEPLGPKFERIDFGLSNEAETPIKNFDIYAFLQQNEREVILVGKQQVQFYEGNYSGKFPLPYEEKNSISSPDKIIFCIEYFSSEAKSFIYNITNFDPAGNIAAGYTTWDVSERLIPKLSSSPNPCTTHFENKVVIDLTKESKEAAELSNGLSNTLYASLGFISVDRTLNGPNTISVNLSARSRNISQMSQGIAKDVQVRILRGKTDSRAEAISSISEPFSFKMSGNKVVQVKDYPEYLHACVITPVSAQNGVIISHGKYEKRIESKGKWSFIKYIQLENKTVFVRESHLCLDMPDNP